MTSNINPEELPSSEVVLEAAASIFQYGVMGGRLNPRDPVSQVLVAGATVIMASAQAGLASEEVLLLIAQEQQNRQRAGTTVAAQERDSRGDRGYL